MHQHSNYRGLRRRRGKKKKGYEKIFEEIIFENFPNIGKESKFRKPIESHTG